MKKVTRKKLMVKKLVLRLDEETCQAIQEIKKEMGMDQANSIRWATRQMAKALKTVADLEKG